MKKIIAGSLVIGFLLLGTVTLNNMNHENTGTNVEQIVKADRKNFSSLQELKSNSEIVVIGTVEKKLNTYNLAKDPSDPSKDSSDFVILGTDYLVNIDRYLKGNGEKQIILTQEGGELNGKKQQIEGRTSMILGNKYVFFLKKNADNKYMFGGNPYKFKLSNGKIKVDIDTNKFEEKFPEMNEDDFIAEITK